jgi:membrane protease YdiL (CAAX protease family)
MSFFHRSLQGPVSIPLQILIAVLVVLSYMFVGQIPLLLVLADHGLMEPEFLADTGLLAEVVGYNKFLTLLIIPFITVLLTVLLANRFLLHRSFLSLFTLRDKLDIKRILFSFTAWFAVMLGMLGLTVLTSDQLSWNLNPQTFVGLALISLFLIPLQTTCEEVLFRGYLLQLFGANFKKGWIPLVMTGLVFGLLHGSNPEVAKIGNILMIYYISTGLFLGLIAIMDDGLELSMGYHAANNIFAALIVTNEWQAFQTDALFMDHTPPAFGWDSLVTLLIFQPVLILLFAKVYKWKNWKERLF